MMLPFVHPRLDELMAFTTGALPERQRERLAAHLRRCSRCQTSLRFVRRVNQSSEAVFDVAASEDVLARAMAARDAGERRILPSPALHTRPARTGRRRAVITAAAAAGVMIVALLTRNDDLAAVSIDSELKLEPSKPVLGATIRASYRPTAGLFVGADSLMLRARLRTPADGMYSEAVPSARVRSVAVLRRGRDGQFTGSFALPDSVVFASLVVESPDASRIDDNRSRLWEIMVHASPTRPTFDALEQRVNDMMGRSWEQGYKTAKQLGELYPNRVASWTLREFFESALFGEAAADSISKVYSRKLDSLIAASKRLPSVPSADIGTIFYRARSRSFRPQSTAEDRAEFEYWLERLRREYPRHEQLAQYIAVGFSKDDWTHPQAVLDSLERAYPRMVPITGPGRNFFAAARNATRRLGVPATQRLWEERALARTRDSSARLAVYLASTTAYRDEGINGVRALVSGPPERLVTGRPLAYTAKAQTRRLDDARRNLFVVLGRALIADGSKRAGLDTLKLGADGGWNFETHRSLVAAYLDAGDTAAAERMRVRLAVDPRVAPDEVAAIIAAGKTRLGAARWDSAAHAARAEFHRILLEQSKVGTVVGAPNVSDANGKMHRLRDLMGGRTAVVIFWSRHCGAAIEALPRIIATAQQLERDGTRVVFVVDEPPSADIARYLADRKWTLPVHHDARGEMSTAFANFGTPMYYVLDAAGRIRFDYANEEALLIAQVGAVRGE